MKKSSIALLLALAAASKLGSAPLNVVEVTSMDIDCLFSANCTPNVQDFATPIPVPGIVGSAFLRTSVYTGEAGTPAAGLFGYLYCLDLRGCDIDPTTQPCLTNVVRCITNQVDCFTNVVVCQTNVSLTNALVCMTNRLPATNIVCCITNTIDATNASQCFPTPWGDWFCCTGVFARTNIVTCITNRIPARDVVICQMGHGWVTNAVTCMTNTVPGRSNVVTCVTNRAPCSGSGPCVRAISINFGRVAGTLDFDNNGTADQGFLLTEGFGSVVPTSVDRTNGVVTINFDPPICPGETSFCIGLVSSNAPTNVTVGVTLTSGRTLQVSAPGPSGAVTRPKPITCDFSRLRQAINQLANSEIIAPSATARDNRRAALLAQVSLARAAADAGNLEGVLQAIGVIISKVDGGRNDWVTPAAARRLTAIINELLTCVENHENGGGGDDHDDDDGHENDEE